MALIPVVTGALTLLGLDDPLYRDMGLPRNALLDSNLRFLGGVWLTLGLAAWWTVPRIERRGDVFRMAWGAVWLAAWDARCPWCWSACRPGRLLRSPCWNWWARRCSSCGSAAWHARTCLREAGAKPRQNANQKISQYQPLAS